MEKPTPWSRLSHKRMVNNYLKYFTPDVKIGISNWP